MTAHVPAKRKGGVRTGWRYAEGKPRPWLDNRPLPTEVAHPCLRVHVCHAGMFARTYEHAPCGGTNRRHDKMPTVDAEGNITDVPFPGVCYKGHTLLLVTATQWG